MVEEGVDERAGEVSGGGVDDEAGGLVEGDEVVVLEEDCERNRLGRGFGGDGGGGGGGMASATTSPGLVRAVARGAGVPLTVTRPAFRRPCTRAREKSGHCPASQASSRSIPASGTVKVRISSCSAMWDVGKTQGRGYQNAHLPYAMT